WCGSILVRADAQAVGSRTARQQVQVAGKRQRDFVLRRVIRGTRRRKRYVIQIGGRIVGENEPIEVDVLRQRGIEIVVVEINIDLIAALRPLIADAIDGLRDNGDHLRSEIELEADGAIGAVVEGRASDVFERSGAGALDADLIEIVRQVLGKANDDLVGRFANADVPRSNDDLVADAEVAIE